MYTVERKQKLIETLRLKNGNKELLIDVKLDLLGTLQKYEKTLRSLSLAQIEIEKGGKNFEKLGNAILEIIEIVFGKKDGQKIIDFYEGDYVELLLDIYPFIINVVSPAYMKVKKQREKEIKQKIKRL